MTPKRPEVCVRGRWQSMTIVAKADVSPNG